MGNTNSSFNIAPFDWSGLESINFTPDQVAAINNQAQQDMQNYLQSPEYKQDTAPTPAPPPVDPSNVIDPSWDPALLKQVIGDLGKVYNGIDPSYADINQTLKGTQYYEQTALDALDGKYFYLSALPDRLADNMFFIFKHQGLTYYTMIENKYIFEQLGYEFIVGSTYFTYAIPKGKLATEEFPDVGFPGYTPPPTYVPPIAGNNPPYSNTDPLDNMPAADIKPPKTGGPLQNGPDSLLTYAPYLLFGGLVFGLLSRGKK
jgi:hypothetical protein